ncbi:hypothetical protein ACU4HD_11095 [Cupriavidus basilensis]
MLDQRDGLKRMAGGGNRVFQIPPSVASVSAAHPLLIPLNIFI